MRGQHCVHSRCAHLDGTSGRSSPASAASCERRAAQESRSFASRASRAACTASAAVRSPSSASRADLTSCVDQDIYAQSLDALLSEICKQVEGHPK